MFAAFLFTLAANKSFAQSSLIPLPVSQQQTNEYFTIDKNCGLQYAAVNKGIENIVVYFQAQLQRIAGFSLRSNANSKLKIILTVNPQLVQEKEGYHLQIDKQQINITGNDSKGLFNGVQTLLNLLPVVRTNETLLVPGMMVKDYPRFHWRGFMLDVSRHFYGVEAIKEILDVMAMLKMNVFHWHLTDNEGWRIEIKKYPKLTSVGAWRTEQEDAVFYVKDTSQYKGRRYEYGGFYTQEQVKEIVAYAGQRNIMVLPEIEMPGHSGAALAAYPQFSCTQQQANVPSAATSGYLNSMQVNYCAGNDSAFLFLQNILTEIMQLFPSPYMHIGGDEVDKTAWSQCAKCKSRKQQENLKDEHELQSWFIKRMEKFLSVKGKKMIGWDEILEGGIADKAIVMSWRGEKGGIAAAGQNHYVIMSPSNPLYFNRYQAGPEGEPLAAKYSINTLKKVYDYEPVPAALDTTKWKYVLGSQAAIWTEFVKTRNHLEYMLYPRLFAFAEVLWSPKEKKNYKDFTERLSANLQKLNQQGINFHTKYSLE